jgi:large subunit ribosomal protein L4
VSADSGKLKVVESSNVIEGKTKDVVAFLAKIDAAKNILWVVDKRDAAKERGSRNIANLKVVSATYLNVYDVMNADTIIINKPALELISEWLGGKK